MQTGLRAFAARGLYPYHIRQALEVKIYLHFLFILPDPEVLESNRASRGIEKYIYSTVHELNMYSEATEALNYLIREDSRYEHRSLLRLNYKVLQGDQVQIEKECLEWLKVLKSHPKR